MITAADAAIVSANTKLKVSGDAPERQSRRHGSGRDAVLLSIKQALITSRLTLSASDAGADPYDRRQGANPGSVWAHGGRR